MCVDSYSLNALLTGAVIAASTGEAERRRTLSPPVDGRAGRSGTFVKVSPAA